MSIENLFEAVIKEAAVDKSVDFDYHWKRIDACLRDFLKDVKGTIEDQSRGVDFVTPPVQRMEFKIRFGLSNFIEYQRKSDEAYKRGRGY